MCESFVKLSVRVFAHIKYPPNSIYSIFVLTFFHQKAFLKLHT